MKLLEIILASFFGAWLKHCAEKKKKKTKDDLEIKSLDEAIDEYQKAKTREEKIAANKRLSKSIGRK